MAGKRRLNLSSELPSEQPDEVQEQPFDTTQAAVSPPSVPQIEPRFMERIRARLREVANPRSRGLQFHSIDYRIQEADPDADLTQAPPPLLDNPMRRPDPTRRLDLRDARRLAEQLFAMNQNRRMEFIRELGKEDPALLAEVGRQFETLRRDHEAEQLRQLQYQEQLQSTRPPLPRHAPIRTYDELARTLRAKMEGLRKPPMHFVLREGHIISDLDRAPLIGEYVHDAAGHEIGVITRIYDGKMDLRAPDGYHLTGIFADLRAPDGYPHFKVPTASSEFVKGTYVSNPELGPSDRVRHMTIAQASAYATIDAQTIHEQLQAGYCPDCRSRRLNPVFEGELFAIVECMTCHHQFVAGPTESRRQYPA